MMGQRRREQDKNPSEIDKLISETQDIESRAVLLVLNSMAKEINGVVLATADIEEKLDAHIAEENQIKDRVIGGAKILAWVIGLAQVFGVSLWIQLRSGFREIATGIAQNRETNATQEVKIKGVERTIDKILDKRQ